MTTRSAKSLLVVRDYFPPQVGGISQMMAHVCTELGSDSIACVTAVDRGPELLDGAGKRVRVHHWPQLFARGLLPATFAHALVWPTLLAAERPALLQFATCHDAYWALLTRGFLDMPFVIYAHGNEILAAETLEWSRPRNALHAAARVFANSHFTAKLLTERINVDPARVRVICPGTDTRRYSPNVSPEPARQLLDASSAQAPILLSVGNLVERKGHDMVLRALPALLRRWPEITYVVAGDGPFRETLTAMAYSLGVASCVRFLGRVHADLLPALYRICDLFVMPSRFRAEHCDVEGFGIVYLEAAASGKPAIGGRSGGTEDAIVDGRTGLLVDPTDAASVTAGIARILESSQFAYELAENARNRVVAEFTWEAFARKLRKEIAEIGKDDT